MHFMATANLKLLFPKNGDQQSENETLGVVDQTKCEKTTQTPSENNFKEFVSNTLPLPALEPPSIVIQESFSISNAENECLSLNDETNSVWLLPDQLDGNTWRQLRQRPSYRKAVHGDSHEPSPDIESKIYHGSCDWTDAAVNGEHIWVPTNSSSDFCYVTESDCSKQGVKMKCSACKIIAHSGCIGHLKDKVKFSCKSTFRDVGVRQYREQTSTPHHWVHRRNQKGRCSNCAKSFQSKLSFASKEIVAIGCSWCKQVYHNKESCFSVHRLQEECPLGLHSSIIAPPSWIIKLPKKGCFKSSLRKSPKKRSFKKRSKKEEIEKSFVVKPIPSTPLKPVIVFINPKSGGNQGAKLMQKFQWLLNPRQVFDLTHGGPHAGLELYKNTPNIRILACGGDGTVGWVLSALDEIGIYPPPPVAVLPLGTGNDLARSIGWGGGYTDEPISKILRHIEEGDVTQLDRWDLKVESNPEVALNTVDDGKDALPLNVFNNYFSLGTDAYIALEFHEAREAKPEKYNSRLKNKMFYGQAGGKDLVLRKFKDLCNFVSVECDGTDLTPRLKELKLHIILFLNIPSYGGGTRPWNLGSSGFEAQRTDDGMIEVVGLTTYQLPFLQAGGHGYSLMQCKTVRVITTKTIPVQVDGEACRLLPSIIDIKLRNRVNMIAKSKIRGTVRNVPTLDKVNINILVISMENYESLHCDKDLLKEAAQILGTLSLDIDTDLETVRLHIKRYLEKNRKTDQLLPGWCYLDSCTAERFFRIDRSLEQLHYITDISDDDIYVLNQEAMSPTASLELIDTDSNISPDLIESADINNSNKLTKTKFRKCLPAECETTQNKDVDVFSSPRAVGSSPASIDLTDVEKTAQTKVILAAKENNLDKLKLLCDSGCNLLSADICGMTALHHAAGDGHKDIVRYLIAYAPPSIMDIVDKKGQTALHMAAALKRRKICCMLVAAGASLNVGDFEKKEPKDLALEADDRDLFAYLDSQEKFQMMVKEDVETAV